MKVYVLIDTNGIPFVFKQKKKAKAYMNICYENDIKYVDTINGMEHYIWKANDEYLTIKKCEVSDD